MFLRHVLLNAGKLVRLSVKLIHLTPGCLSIYVRIWM